MNYLKKMWDVYSALVVPADASEQQRKVTEYTFFAGASAVFTLLTELEPTASDLAVMDALHAELREFGERLDKKHGFAPH